VEPNGECESVSDLDFGPIGFFDKATKFEINDPISPDMNNTSIWTENFIDGACFSGEYLYGEYIKDGKLHRGKIKPCNERNSNGGYRPFTLRYQETLYGNMITVGNTVLVVPDPNDVDCDEYTNGPYMSDTQRTNAGYNMCAYYADNTVMFPSTYAELNFPDREEIRVKWAGLYWQSIVPNGTDLNGMQIKIRHENANTYTFVGFDQLDWVTDDGEEGYTSYSAFKDITSYFQNGGYLDGKFYVGNIPAYEGQIPELGSYGAWTLVIVYEDIQDKVRQFSIYDGYQIVSVNTPEVEVDISGFRTPKEAPVNSEVSIFTAEGDKYIENDYLKIKPSQDPTWTLLSHTTNQTFYSAVNTVKPFIRKPFPSNNQGIDIQSFNLGTTGYDVIKPNESAVTFKFGSDQDTYWPSMIAFNTELYTPDLCYDYTYGQNGHFITSPYTDRLYIKDTFNPNSPLGIKLYVKNRENSDVILDNVSLRVEQIDTNQAKYKRESTQIAPPGDTMHPLSDSGREVNDGYDRNITIGSVGSLEHFYVYYGLDLLQSDIDMPINVYIDYDLVIDNLNIGHQSMPLNGMPICQDTGTYLPERGRFNVVHKNETRENDPYYYYNLPTQIVGRAGHFLVEQMDETDLDKSLRNDATTATIAAIEMIDVAGFHFTNATCTDENTTTASNARIWSIIEPRTYAKEINTAELNDKKFFSSAIANAAFRISYNTLPDGSSITLEKLSNGNYKFIDFPDYDPGQSCQPTFCETHNECTVDYWCNDESGMNAESVKNCMECIYGFNTKVLCSRDNFSIRPESYRISFNDQDENNRREITNNIPAPSETRAAAGYTYAIDINATDHLNRMQVPRYDTKDLNASYIWSPTNANLICNNEENASVRPSLFNGNGSVTLVSPDIGRYRLVVWDDKWTGVDHNLSKMQHHFVEQNAEYFRSGKDCIENDTVTRTSAEWTQNGCSVSSLHTNNEPGYQMRYDDINITFYPYSFDMNGLSFIRGIANTPYIYVNTPGSTDHKMRYNVIGTYFAAGANGAPTTNFTRGCYGDDLNMTMIIRYIQPDIPHDTPLFSYDIIETNTTDSTIVYRDHSQNPLSFDSSDVYFDETYNNGIDPATLQTDTNVSLTLYQFKQHLANDMKGAVTLRLGYNFIRRYNHPINPRNINFKGFRITYKTPVRQINADMQSDYQPTGYASIETNATFVYGRVHPAQYLFDNVSAAQTVTPLSIEAYCDKTVNQCKQYGAESITPDTLEESATSDWAWWIVRSYGIGTDGNVTLTASEDGNVTPEDPQAVPFTNGISNSVKVGNESDTLPNIVDIDLGNATSTWLIYNKDADAVPSPFYRVRFIGGNGGWTGKGKTGHVVGDDINSRKTDRLEW
jgi:hypothetical protein